MSIDNHSSKDQGMKFSTVLLLLTFFPLAQAHDKPARDTSAASVMQDQTASPIKVVESFSASLQAGNLARAGSLLADDGLILESGGVERSREEYLGGHALHAAEFLKAAHIQPINRSAGMDNGFAWVGTDSKLHASKDGKPIALLSTETMVLKNTPDSRRIVHIHWSSRPKR